MGKRIKSSRKNDSFAKQDTSNTSSNPEIPKNSSAMDDEKQRKELEVARSELETMLNSLDQDEASIKSNNVVLRVLSNSKKYFCSVCKVTINSLGSHIELRFSIWEHINSFSHRSRLFSFPQVVKQSFNNVNDVFENISDSNPFVMGPTKGFFMCTMCLCAVPSDSYHIKNHFREEIHCKKKDNTVSHSNNTKLVEKLYTKIQDEGKEERQKQFIDLISALPDELKSKVYLEMGCIPGYVNCILCCKAIISTPFHLECHVFDHTHQSLISFSESKKNTYLSLISSTLEDSVLKENSKYLFKQYLKDCYFCQLCGVEFNGENVSLLCQNIKSHFKDKVHIENVKSGWKVDSEHRYRFPLLEVFPENVLSDIKYISVSELRSEQMSCYLCDCILFPSELIILIDHLQSERHEKNKNKVICSQKWETVETIFEEIVSNQKGKGSNPFFKPDVSKFQELITKERFLLDKKFFELEGLQLICQLCKSAVGKSYIDISEMRCKLTEHALSERHKKLVATYLEVVQEKREKEKELARLMVRLLEVDRSSKGCFKLSKKPDIVKCRACRVKVPLLFECLKDHIEQDEHRDNIDKIRSQNKSDVWSP